MELLLCSIGLQFNTITVLSGHFRFTFCSKLSHDTQIWFDSFSHPISFCCSRGIDFCLNCAVTNGHQLERNAACFQR